MAELYETTTTCSYLSYKNGGRSSIKHHDTCKIYKTMILLNKNQWKSTDLYVFSHQLAFVCSLKLIINHFSYCHGFSRPTIFLKKSEIWCSYTKCAPNFVHHNLSKKTAGYTCVNTVTPKKPEDQWSCKRSPEICCIYQ